MTLPLCFILMPFGRKPNLSGQLVDFDAVYRQLIAPAVSQVGLEAIRADQELAGGIIQKPMFERLLLCPFAVADLTTANANVLYELGIRHAARPWSTVPIFAADGTRLPFDVSDLRALPYSLSRAGLPCDLERDKAALVKRLRAARSAAADQPLTDSPIFQLVNGYPDITAQISSDKTDVFRDQVRYSQELKNRLAEARKRGVDALRSLEAELSEEGITSLEGLCVQEAGVIIDLFLSYRAVEAWGEMVALAEKMPKLLCQTVLVQEQLALALKRTGQGERAEGVLLALIERRGPSSETYGILGRVYKDRWEKALNSQPAFVAESLLDKAIGAYLKGFESDWRDAYPGINALTLIELKSAPDPRKEELLPVVAYAVKRRIAAGDPDYWDFATQLELAVLARDKATALKAAGDALAAVRESWEPATTARNLRLIRQAREQRRESVPW
ncbi:MAG: TRAFs-binding domain-containing protein, partial [Desulfobacterales bacterium]